MTLWADQMTGGLSNGNTQRSTYQSTNLFSEDYYVVSSNKGTLDLINSIDYHADEVVPASPPTQEMNIDCGPCPVVRLIYYGVMSIGLHN